MSSLHFLAPGKTVVFAVMEVRAVVLRLSSLSETLGFGFSESWDPMFFFPWILYIGLTFSFSLETR